MLECFAQSGAQSHDPEIKSFIAFILQTLKPDIHPLNLFILALHLSGHKVLD